jgi:glycosyltransferase involved in cell wall biosynthesis
MSRLPRLVFLSNVAVPYQVNFCNALQAHIDAQFWFYEHPDRTRGAWWRVDLGRNCRVLEDVLFLKSGPLAARYLPRHLGRELDRFDPDIVMLGGFSIPGNYLAYRWARRHGKKTIVFTERSRDPRGVLRRPSLGWRLLRWLYRAVDMVMVSADDAVTQFRDELGFGDKVVAGRYGADLDGFFAHPDRQPKRAYTFLFANRLTEIYNPLAAIDAFAAVLKRHPGSRLVMNASGELAHACRERVAALGLESAVEFLTKLKAWSDLPPIYARCDIFLLPATFSNGNGAMLEAMASGMGIVISDRVLGVGKLVQDGVNGFNCAPTAAAFEERIERYIARPELLREHAAHNRPLVEPLSGRGTAKFFAERVRTHLGISAA